MENKTLTPADVRNIFEYRNGDIYWKERPLDHFKRDKDYRTWQTKCKGKISKNMTDTGYVFTRIFLNGKYETYRNHWLVWVMFNDKWPTCQIDHIDRNPLNNKIENLRLSDNLHNKKNRGRQINNTSGVNGVFWNKATNSWRATIQVSGKSMHIGLYQDLEGAKEARKEKELEMGFHETHGEII